MCLGARLQLGIPYDLAWALRVCCPWLSVAPLLVRVLRPGRHVRACTPIKCDRVLLRSPSAHITASMSFRASSRVYRDPACCSVCVCVVSLDLRDCELCQRSSRLFGACCCSPTHPANTKPTTRQTEPACACELSLKKGGAGESGFCYEAGASVEVAPEDALLTAPLATAASVEPEALPAVLHARTRVRGRE